MQQLHAVKCVCLPNACSTLVQDQGIGWTGRSSRSSACPDRQATVSQLGETPEGQPACT